MVLCLELYYTRSCVGFIIIRGVGGGRETLKNPYFRRVHGVGTSFISKSFEAWPIPTPPPPLPPRGGGGGGGRRSLVNCVPMREQRTAKLTLNSVFDILKLIPLFTWSSQKVTLSNVEN